MPICRTSVAEKLGTAAKTHSTSRRTFSKSDIAVLMRQAVQLHQKGDLSQAEQIYRQVLSAEPRNADANQFLGMIALKTGHVEPAIKLVSNSVALDPNRFQCHFILGEAFATIRKEDQAIAHYRKCIKLKPDHIEAHNNLGVLFKTSQRYEEAIECFKDVIALKPDSGYALGNLGNVLKESGRMQEAVTYLEQAVRRQRGFSSAYSNLLLALNYCSDIAPESVFNKHTKWHEHCFQSKNKERFNFNNRGEKVGTKLRIGYVSPDLHTHSVSYFLAPLFEAYNKSKFEVFAYYCNSKHDKTSAHLKSCIDHWRDVGDFSDEALADLIYEDEIDILVDLTGHMANNRLAVFVQKPAPVQITWLGYPNTTGLSQIDYRITDEQADPSGLTDPFNTEKLFRLEFGFLCYSGDDKVDLCKQLPADKKGYVTFGSFNNLVKVTPEVVKVWADILKCVKESKLLLKSTQLSDPQARQHCLDLFEQNGIQQKRLILHGMLPKTEDHLALYSEIDVGLDPFPYNGTTTTCEAAWMGVPTLTLSGDVHASRVGHSILTRLELHEFIAANKEAYVERAANLARDLDRLRTIRAGLRERMKDSALCDKASFTNEMENAFSAMWETYCAK